MTRHIKKFFILTFLALCFTFIPVSAQAGDYGTGDVAKETGGLLPTRIAGAGTVPELVGAIIAIILGLLGIVFFLLIFYAGLLWMTARGDSGKIDTAKDLIQAAVIGLVIIMASYALTRFVFKELTPEATTPAPTTPAAPTP